MPAMKRFVMHFAISLLTFVLGVALYIHFAFGLNIIFANNPKFTFDQRAQKYHCTGLAKPSAADIITIGCMKIGKSHRLVCR